MLSPRLWKVAPLLFCSGLCALVYQTVWLRELRLVFGASTAASSAVLAIFMAGLGLGSALLGKRADAHPRPLALYAQLEGAIALLAAASPLLLSLARLLYLALGGTQAVGSFFGTVLRLLFSAFVLLLPTVAMGATLPAAARAVETNDDSGRRSLAILYGINTLGAVTGTVLSTFFLLEVFGARTTLWLAALCNLLVAVVANVLARKLAAEGSGAEAPASAQAARREQPQGPLPPRRWVLLAAGVVGFAFMLCELVWYRMLAPILGGSTFTFGIILAVALAGIGLGGAAYAAWFRERPVSLRTFAFTALLEGALVALPLSLGDDVAISAALLRSLGATGFFGLALGWVFIAGVAILPAALVSGFQFPVLLALLGRGREGVGSDVGGAYAYNTLGSILGSLAGGFGLLPLLGAVGAWRLAAALLLALGAASALASARREPGRLWLVPASLAALCGVLLVSAKGPTAAWRHSGIGVGRVAALGNTINDVRRWAREQQQIVLWERDGVESAIAMATRNGLAFVVNGKSDGNAVLDAPTQVMGGLLGALLHGEPKTSMVVGLGTGSTAGWLGAVPGMERVDVVEIEPDIVHVATACEAVNQAVLKNPKVRLLFDDAREVLLTGSARYDILFSEPSNPYRAGIASLFTLEFYQAVKQRLAPNGLFIQWLQAYDVDPKTVRVAMATLGTVFPEVEVWQAHGGDLLLVASSHKRSYDVQALRDRMLQEPYRSALRDTWRALSVEDVLARHLAGPALARALVAAGEDVNTDDLPLIEFAFARSVGQQALFSLPDLVQTSRALGLHRPQVSGAVDWEAVELAKAEMEFHAGQPGTALPHESARTRRWRALYEHAGRGDAKSAAEAWRALGEPPQTLLQRESVAQALAAEGDEAALTAIEGLRPLARAEADALTALYWQRKGDGERATDALVRAFDGFGRSPWSALGAVDRALTLSTEIARKDRLLGRRLFDALKEPFAAYALNNVRLTTRSALSRVVDPEGLCAQVQQAWEPNVPWVEAALQYRLRCYASTQHPLLPTAQAEYEQFQAHGVPRFGADLLEAAREVAAERGAADGGERL